MFDKNKFAQILKNISESYENQRDFAKKSGINRTYLSQYINMKLDKPPKPDILEKLAKSSKGFITYEELMFICGYINDNSNTTELFFFYNLLDNLDKEHKKSINKLTFEEYKIYHDLNEQLIKCLFDDYTTPDTFNPDNILDDLDFLSSKTRYKLYNCLKDSFTYYYKRNQIEKAISKLKSNTYDLDNLIFENESFNQKSKLSNNHITSNSISSFYTVPILGKITAGQPILVDENIEGYLPVDPNIYGMKTSNDLFYLKVSGESMNLKVHNGDYALIHKQDYAENGDIVVAIVNGNEEATLKRYKKISDEIIMLEPMSTYPMEPLIINLKETNFKIIGKAIGQFGKF